MMYILTFNFLIIFALIVFILEEEIYNRSNMRLWRRATKPTERILQILAVSPLDVQDEPLQRILAPHQVPEEPEAH